MKIALSRFAAVLTLVMALFFLGGCLSQEKSTSDFAGNTPAAQNSPPTISGNPPPAVMMGQSYSYTPVATDPDGDVLTFSGQNFPAWATLDPVTGELSGRPTLADVGVYEQIVLSVSDGVASASTDSFSITVSQSQLGSMTLSWTPPVENTDGSSLTDLAGYRIYFGESEGNYPNRVLVNTPGLASYVVENLVPATYYVVATAINSAGVESAYSNVAVKTVQ